MTVAPEIRFLIRCLPPTHGTSHVPLQELPPLDWISLAGLAVWHGMFPLLATQLLSPAVQNSSLEIDDELLANLKSHRSQYISQSLAQTAALLELQREFDRCGIKVLPWKGPSVAILLYGSPTLRESGDLDFLFQEENLKELQEITGRLGYRLTGGEPNDAYLYLLARQGEFTFIRMRDRVILEFQLGILSPRFSHWQNAQVDIERASTVCRLAGHDFLMQAPEDLLVGLCAHGTKHNWERLKWSCDIAQFLKIYGNTLDWEPFLIRLRTERKHSVVLLGLALASNLFDFALPSVVQEALRQSSDVAPLAEAVAAHIMSGSTETIENRYERKMIAFLCPSLWARIVHTMRPVVALNDDDLYIPIHNRMLFFMNYFFRVVRLVRKYGPMQLATKIAAVVRSGR